MENGTVVVLKALTVRRPCKLAKAQTTNPVLKQLAIRRRIHICRESGASAYSAHRDVPARMYTSRHTSRTAKQECERRFPDFSGNRLSH